MNKQQLASKIWASANKMRSKIEANEYKDYILGFIFYKFLSDKEEELLRANQWTDEDIKNDLNESLQPTEKNYIQQNLGYFISYKHLFSTWIAPGAQFDASQVTDALLAFERNIYQTHHRVFDKIFNTLQTGLSKLGETNGARTKAILELLKLIKDIPTDDSQDYDVLGFIYEYLISNFAANAGKKAGEFYTPHEVALLMAEIVSYHLRDRQQINIYDPTSGSGSLLINIGKAASKHLRERDSIKYYAQELKENTYNLTRMNLVMRGIKPDNIQTRCGDTLDRDWPWFDENDPLHSYNPLYVDAVVSNPPYSQQWDNKDKESEPRYADYGVAPKGKADYAFLLHDLYHVKPDGIMTIVLPHGVLFRGKEEENIRRNLIEKNHIDAIIGLPANIFFGTGIPTIIMVLRQKREHTDTLFIDASRLSIKVGKQNKLTASDIKRIADTYIERNPQDPTFARLVSREEIRRNEYNLNIPRYIDSADKPEQWDAHSIMFGGLPKSEIDELASYWNAFPSLKGQLFRQSDTPYTSLNTEDITSVIYNNPDVQNWEHNYSTSFETFPATLHQRLIDNIMQVSKEKEQNSIAQIIFDNLSQIPLVDKYEAYQILDDNYRQIATDIEIIQSETFNATRVVEPKMVVKKKDGIDIEVQDGFQGRILPFDLVQKEMLTDSYNELQALLVAIADIDSSISDTKNSFEEDELQEPYYDSEKQDFIAKGLAAKAKEIRKDLNGSQPEEDSFEARILLLNDLSDKAKKLRKEAKAAQLELLAKTIELIPTLSDEQVKVLLHVKWISPLHEQLLTIPGKIMTAFCAKITRLASKYGKSLQSIEQEKTEVEARLSTLIDSLTGNQYDMAAFHQLKTMIGGQRQ